MKNYKDFYEEYIKVNGIEHYLIHYYRKSDKTIIFLHGGPAQSEAHFLYITENYKSCYNLIYYDQRGAGRTQIKNNTKTKDITIENLIEDLKCIIDYVRIKYKSDNIILLGHSWGTVLGIEFIKKYHNYVSAYIGMGQVINFLKGEKTAFTHCFEIVKNSKSKKYIKKMEEMRDYPFNIDKDNIWKAVMKFRIIQVKYGLAGYHEGTLKLMNIIRKSPIFSLKDLFAYISVLKVNKNLLDYLIDFDISSYKSFKIPIFFICGSHDWQVPTIEVKKYFETIISPEKNIFIVENAGHLLNIENVQDYNIILNDVADRV